MLRIRDFLETVEGLIFSSVSYFHPEEKYHAYLRYYPDEHGERLAGDRRYSKVSSTSDAEAYLRKNYPMYIDEEGQGVLKERVVRIYRPENRLTEILENPVGDLEEKVCKLSQVFSEIPDDKKGVTGSLLVGLHSADSDIDFVIYGVKNHIKARERLGELFGQGVVRELTEKEWRHVYEKRFPNEKTLDFNEFLWHERRKNHKL